MPFPKPLIDVALYVTTGKPPNEIEPEARKQLEKLFSDFINKEIDLEQACETIRGKGYDTQAIYKLKRVLSSQPNNISNFSTPKSPPANHHVRHRSVPWTLDEDELLLAGIYHYGFADWQKVCEFVGNGRSRSQCGQRWLRCLDPSKKKDRWTHEEDLKLFQLVQIHGNHSWSKISKEMGNRTDVQCRYRYESSQKKNPFNFQFFIPYFQQLQMADRGQGIQGQNQETIKHIQPTVSINVPNIPLPLQEKALNVAVPEQN
ncbi:Myb-like DNA-binding domain containing protein [Histomonas meleagridis]|uniref:Myb-like DNA-binding domain containing protein n=1 Tax=Histomonas meleagridis TaxID=135588 RepID=UPI00355A4A9D|nr:Myb-like DNA-binding domain containing protein [Histomonas meleagridis]KAH0798039.1 Myb-like DNA-binding domain containing protein [Histomonas meleagridis]